MQNFKQLGGKLYVLCCVERYQCLFLQERDSISENIWTYNFISEISNYKLMQENSEFRRNTGWNFQRKFDKLENDL